MSFKRATHIVVSFASLNEHDVAKRCEKDGASNEGCEILLQGPCQLHDVIDRNAHYE
jgi:hypothetical protein